MIDTKHISALYGLILMIAMCFMYVLMCVISVFM